MHNPGTTAGGARIVLLVEENDGLRALMTNALRGNGYRVHAPTDPEAAARLAEDSALAADLLLTPLTLSRGDGLSLAGRFRRARPAGRVLYLEADAPAALRAKGIDPERCDHLDRPFTIEELLLRVDALAAVMPKE